MSADPAAWTLTRSVATSRGEIAWDVFGDGPPVVLVHGTAGRSVLWRNVAPVLSEHFAMHVFDLLGFGQSERHEDQELSIRVQGQVLAELVATARCPRTASARSPLPSCAPRRSCRCRPTCSLPTSSNGKASRASSCGSARCSASTSRTLPTSNRCSSSSKRPRGSCGAYTRGGCRPDLAAAIEARLQAADRIMIPDAGHFSPEEQPGAVAAALDEFLR